MKEPSLTIKLICRSGLLGREKEKKGPTALLGGGG